MTQTTTATDLDLVVLANSTRPPGYWIYDLFAPAWDSFSSLLDLFSKSGDVPKFPRYDLIHNVTKDYSTHTATEQNAVKERFCFHGRVTGLIEQGGFTTFIISDETGSASVLASASDLRARGLRANQIVTIYCSLSAGKPSGFVLED